MNVALLEYANRNIYNAGSKAREDALKIAELCGYKHIPLYQSGINKGIVALQICKSVFQTIIQTSKDDKIFVQYPYHPGIVNRVLFKMLTFGKKVKNYSLILLLHDVALMRDERFLTKEGSRLLKKELDSFHAFDKVICHNEFMKKKFLEVGGTGNYVVLTPFDYLYGGHPALQTRKDKPTVVIAGNLKEEKSGYVYQLAGKTHVYYNLYGSNYSGPENDFVQYKGGFSPDELIEHLEGDYGLVWDGPSCNTCEGVFGQYLKFNNPHKFSLYVAAELPVIIWNESALKDYVEENNIGIVVESIEDMENKLKLITKNRYAEMKINLHRIRCEILGGKHLSKWL